MQMVMHNLTRDIHDDMCCNFRTHPPITQIHQIVPSLESTTDTGLSLHEKVHTEREPVQSRSLHRWTLNDGKTSANIVAQTDEEYNRIHIKMMYAVATHASMALRLQLTDPNSRRTATSWKVPLEPQAVHFDA